jgi:hypothetical protein
MAEENAPLIECLEASRAAILDEFLQEGICGSNPAAVAELAGQVNVINQLLTFLKVK